jgi:raffinose/stachyose/melibiose transport system substrate-binding protein
MVKGKRILVLLTLAAIVAFVAACSGGNGNGGDSKSGNNKGGLAKISIFQSKVEIAEQLETLAKQYTEETGNEVEVWGSVGDAYITQLQAKLTANQGPSIFSIGYGSEAETFKSYYYDLSNEPYVDDIAPNMALVIDGKVVGVPYGVEGFGLVYNKKLVNPADIKDLDSFTAALQNLKNQGVNGFSLSQEAYFLIGHILNTPFALQPDPQAFIEKLNSGQVKMAETKEFQEFARFLEAIRAHAVNPMEITYDKQMGDFATGKTAIVHQGNWSYGMLKDYGELDFEYGMMPFPLAGNDKIAVGQASNWVINGTAKPEEIEAAKAFLNWLFTSETGKNAIVNEFKFVPAMTTIKADNLDPLSQEVYDAAQSGKTIPWAMNFFPQGIIVNDLAPAAQEFFLDANMTGEQFLKKLDEVWANAVK